MLFYQLIENYSNYLSYSVQQQFPLIFMILVSESLISISVFIVWIAPYSSVGFWDSLKTLLGPFWITSSSKVPVQVLGDEFEIPIIWLPINWPENNLDYCKIKNLYLFKNKPLAL